MNPTLEIEAVDGGQLIRRGSFGQWKKGDTIPAQVWDDYLAGKLVDVGNGNHYQRHTDSSRIVRNRRPSTPGRILLAHHIDGEGLTLTEFARKIGLPFQMVDDIVHDRRQITATLAQLLADKLGTTPDLWLNLQAAVDRWDFGLEKAA